jgi:hypothetical protein
MGPEAYLQHIAKCKLAFQIPIIASLNGMTAGGWIGYAKEMQLLVWMGEHEYDSIKQMQPVQLRNEAGRASGLSTSQRSNPRAGRKRVTSPLPALFFGPPPRSAL